MLTVFLYILHLNGFLNIGLHDTTVAQPVGGYESNLIRDGDMSSNHIVTVIDVDEFLRNLPQHLSPLSHQAGGHTFSTKMGTLGMLKDSQGHVLKPLDCERRKNELNFYREVNNGYYPKLAPLIPRFHGTASVPFKGTNVEFMVLDDLADGFGKPCVLDVKIGQITFTPGALLDKIEREKRKYAVCKNYFGFYISGMVVIDPKTNGESILDRKLVQTLNPETAVKEIERFFHSTGNSPATAALLKRVILKLERILDWALTQTELRLYASSIIILYDSQALLNMIPKIDEENEPGNPLGFVRVKIVDFTYTQKAPEHEGVDENFLYGVNSVLNIFQKILSKHSNSM